MRLIRRSALLVVGMLLFAAGPLRAADAPRRPNILFLLADDWAWPHASLLEMPEVRTPTFDRLAREGVLFTNAHSAAPSCSPSRAAILTGQWHWRLGEGANLRGFLAARFPVYPDLLEKSGYFVGFTGKGYGPGAQGDRKRNAAGPSFASFKAFLAARPQGKPFCFWFGSHEPHRPYKSVRGRRGGPDPANVKVPPYLPDSESVRNDICDYYGEVQQFDHECDEVLNQLKQTGELDDTLIVSTGDNGWPFPRCKATCYLTGTHQPLVVRWGSRVKGGRTVDDFVSLSDLAPSILEAAGVARPAEMTGRSILPLLTGDRSGWIDPQRSSTLTGMETHVPCRALPGGGQGGYPMRTLITRDFHYIRNFHPERWPAGDPPAGAMPDFGSLREDTFLGFADCDAGISKASLMTQRDEPAVRPFYERAFGKRPGRELYDLRNDPYELKNVAEEPSYADKVAELDKQLMARLTETKDPRATGDGDRFDHYKSEQPAKGKKKSKRM